jgi:hypothetical protein
LLSIALREPGVVANVERSVKDALAECATEDVFADIVSYIDKNPDVELSDVLGRWAGHAAQAEIATLSRRPLHLDSTALSAEFAEGLQRYVEQRARHGRQVLLARMKDSPSADKLEEFWALRREASGAEKE